MAVSPGLGRPRGRPQNKEKLRRLFLRHVFTLLKLGYERLDSKAYQASEEPDITGEIGDAIQEVLEDRRCRPPRWARQFFVHDEASVPGTSRKGKRRERTDLHFEFSGPDRRAHFYVEAKRLSAGRFPVSRYLGSQGLGKFVSGSYGRNDPDGGMLGYVQTGTFEEWAAKIESGIEKREEALEITATGSWKAETVVASTEHTYLTIHARPAVGRPISIHHLLLDFTTS